MKYTFSENSLDKLMTCESSLIQITRKALSYGIMDFSVIEGHRTIERQNELFNQKLTKLDGYIKMSKHNYVISRAIDLLPYPTYVNKINVWKDSQRFCVLAGLIYAASCELGHSVVWGGDWNGDGNNADSNFMDMAHFELK